MAERQLPDEFADLAPYIAWALPTERERSMRRHAVSMIELRAFYDAMVARMPSILSCLDKYAEDNTPAEVNRLFLLTLALAEIAPAVENFGQPGVLDGYDFSRFIPIHD